MHNILVFKTNIHTPEQILKVNTLLANRIEFKKWNIDLDDCDKVLRVEAAQQETEKVIGILKPHEIFCEELV